MALGKITELPWHFYRLVLNEHLLLIPVLIFCTHKSIKKMSYFLFFIPPLLVTLSTNLTRIYLLAWLVGLLFLFNKQHWRRWLAISAGTLIFFFLSFTIVHLSSSRGVSLGWELFGLRLQSIAAPETENSSLSRMLLLPKILDNIRLHPILGNGLGDTVTVFSPIFQRAVTTPNFDWGYLEVWDELGLLGVIVWLGLIVHVFYRSASHEWSRAALISLLVINLTSPAIFHVLGIVLILIIFAI